jgi:hypothetical protein
MATTNEDATILATARVPDIGLLVARQLSDRGTIEIGFWEQRDGAPALQAPALEIAAEPGEVEVLQRLCREVAAASWGGAEEGQEIAASPPLADGDRLAALRAGDDVVIARVPERDDRIRLSRPALDLLLGDVLPAAGRKLAALGAAQPS